MFVQEVNHVPINKNISYLFNIKVNTIYRYQQNVKYVQKKIHYVQKSIKYTECTMK